MPFEALGYIVVGVYDDGELDSNHHSKGDISLTLNINYITEVTKMVLSTLIYEAHTHFRGTYISKK
jgi:hypothetical protein